jgi:hypothetical protein
MAVAMSIAHLALSDSGVEASASSSSGHATVTPPDKASTSNRGVVGNEINVSLPVANPSAPSRSSGSPATPKTRNRYLRSSST